MICFHLVFSWIFKKKVFFLSIFYLGWNCFVSARRLTVPLSVTFTRYPSTLVLPTGGVTLEKSRRPVISVNFSFSSFSKLRSATLWNFEFKNILAPFDPEVRADCQYKGQYVVYPEDVEGKCSILIYRLFLRVYKGSYFGQDFLTLNESRPELRLSSSMLLMLMPLVDLG